MNYCIIYLVVSDNVMHVKIVNALKLTVTLDGSSCYSMESNKFPLVGNFKDGQVDLGEFPDKKVSMTILIVDI